MFNLYQYLKERADKLKGVESVVRVRDRWKLDDLIADVREVAFPCVAVEVAGDGMLSLKDGRYARTNHTFHVLLQPEDLRAPDMEMTETVIMRAEEIGVEILSMMNRESRDRDDPCFGFEAENIHFARLATSGMQTCGCTFNIVIRRDHE